MDYIERLAEARMLEAVARGELDDLPGAGQPLELDDDSLIPAELRVANRILKNAGFTPPEVTLRREIRDVEVLIRDAVSADLREQHGRRLRQLMLRLSLAGGGNLAAEADYIEQLNRRLSSLENGRE